MSRSAEVTLDWGDDAHVFALKWGQMVELQEQCDAGPYVVLGRLADGTWRVQDVEHTIRLGLIGGGMAPADALRLVRVYVTSRPPMESVLTAQAVLAAGVMGAPDEVLGKANAGAKGSTRSRAASSRSPKSTGSAPPSD